ncbi:hypothetical protein PPW95_25515 (plasmid) [Vibrio parahaemolyticus]|uniref:hypothetical protein n=1 Tax=Vibrio harveyi group TaxID=717610 RepID=UPI000971B837|nr:MULTISPECIES: hypothetical protein [Vibrio harveyi group]APX10099.1 hypothetical protein BWP24_28330 [Vibrio campbellii]ARR10495.1 unknow [Vibrio campbellii]WCP78863.1 hypothetical protein PPW95_25515 [Vibrio parahaemolyticus]WHP52942.1 hypothetical protein QMY43_25330 [Vibrio parahaemolyticus]
MNNKLLIAVSIAACFSTSAFAEQDDVEVKQITTIPLSAKAHELIKFSQDAMVQNARKNALRAKAEANKLADQANTIMPTLPVIQPHEQQSYSEPVDQPMVDVYTENQTVTTSVPTPEFQEVSVVDQLGIQSIMRVGDRIEANVSYGRDVIPVKVGTMIDKATVLEINDTHVVFLEDGKVTKRYPIQKDIVFESEEKEPESEEF